ncbi:branched-chain amino acid ABC transporter permease [Daeguia caeni]|uniref:Branched-chain amino acid ABC transporter permease n=1 Tax=Daeguia caeni TaxID=439612 RepID=A0ABV9H8D8_9HYPH
MSYFFQIIISGILVGSIYAMAALGFTIVFNATRVINFANGEFLVIGGLATAVLAVGGMGAWPVWLAVAVAMLATTVVGAAMQLLAINHARSKDPHMLVILTIGITLMLRGACSLIFGRDVLFMQDFGLFQPMLIGSVYIPSQGIWIVLSLIAVSLALWFMFTHTVTGRAMQAAAMEPRAAGLCGIEVRTMSLLAFAIAGAIGGLAGALMSPIAPPFYENGVVLGLKGFSASIVGGLGNPVGAVIGGLLIGIIESASAGYGLSGYKDAVSFLILVAILIACPSGLLGRTSSARV